MKHNVVAYLAKEGVTLEELVDTSSRPHLIEIREENLIGSLYLNRSLVTPKWVTLFDAASIPERLKRQATLRGLLIVE